MSTLCCRERTDLCSLHQLNLLPIQDRTLKLLIVLELVLLKNWNLVTWHYSGVEMQYYASTHTIHTYISVYANMHSVQCIFLKFKLEYLCTVKIHMCVCICVMNVHIPAHAYYSAVLVKSPHWGCSTYVYACVSPCNTLSKACHASHAMRICSSLVITLTLTLTLVDVELGD